MTPNEIEKVANDVAEETQLDRIEKKLDMLFEKLEQKYVTQSVLIQTAQTLQTQIKQIHSEDKR